MNDRSDNLFFFEPYNEWYIRQFVFCFVFSTHVLGECQGICNTTSKNTTEEDFRRAKEGGKEKESVNSCKEA